MDKRLQWAIAQIMKKINPEFYGSVTLVFQAGTLHCIKTEQTEKPENAV